MTLARHVEDAAAAAGAGPGRHAARAEDLAAARRGPRQHRAAASGRPCASRPIRRRWPRTASTLEDVRTAIAQRQRQPGQGQLRRPDARVDDRRQRPAAARPTSTSSSIVAYKNGAPIRLADVADVDRRRREHAPRRVGERRAGDHRQHPAPAGRQRDRGGRPRQAAAAAAAGVAAGVGRRRAADRPHRRPSARRCTTCSSSCCSPSRWS